MSQENSELNQEDEDYIYTLLKEIPPSRTPPPEISSDHSLRRDLLKTLALNILKEYPETLANYNDIPGIEPCSLCDKEILTTPLTIIILVCGHTYHRICIEKELLITVPSKC